MSQSIVQLMNDLPQSNLTTQMLSALDFVAPGEWQNIVGFEAMVKAVAGELPPERVAEIQSRVEQRFSDPELGYQRALWVYQTVDRVDAALASAALANKAGERIKFLAFLNKLVPKADTVQAVDLAMKLVAELIAYSSINGLPTGISEIQTFAGGLARYSGASLIRMAALLSIEGIIPLGPDFLDKATNAMKKSPGTLEKNAAFTALSAQIPGEGIAGKLGFITGMLDGLRGWINDFVAARGISAEKVSGSLKQYIEFTDETLDYVAAFLDLSTNYYTHTGIQSLARHAIEAAVKEA